MRVLACAYYTPSFLKINRLIEHSQDLLAPPGNHLEALRDNRSGQYSIRINSQYRLCFNWTKDGPRNAEVVDYH